jgi:hypothetical protein
MQAPRQNQQGERKQAGNHHRMVVASSEARLRPVVAFVVVVNRRGQQVEHCLLAQRWGVRPAHQSRRVRPRACFYLRGDKGVIE